MKTQDVHSIEKILHVKFQECQKSFAKVVATEAKLRADLAKIDRMASAAEPTGYKNMQAIGADVIWRAWMGRTKSDLNLELAQVLAQKETLKGRVKKEYGRLLASRSLLKDARTRAYKSAQKTTLEKSIEQHLLNAAFLKK